MSKTINIIDTKNYDSILTENKFMETFICLYGVDDAMNVANMPVEDFNALYDKWCTIMLNEIMNDFVKKLEKSIIPVKVCLLDEYGEPTQLVRKFKNFAECVNTLSADATRFKVELDTENNKVYITYWKQEMHAKVAIDNANFYMLEPYELSNITIEK